MSNVPSTAVRRQIMALIPVYMNTMMVGCSSGWFANAVYFILVEREVHATSSQCAIIASLSELGRFIFAVPTGILVDKYGRKIIILSSAVLNFFAWLGLSLNSSIDTIYFMRFITGVAQALINGTSLISVGEISSPEIRGKLAGIYSIFMNIGRILPSIISVTFSSYNSLTWSVTLLSFLTLLSTYWATETPSYLISALKLNQAKDNLQQIRQGYQESEINSEYEKLKQYIEEERIRKNSSNWLEFLKSKSIRNPMLTGILSNFLAVSTGSLLIRAYITVIIPSNEIVPTNYYPLANQILTLFASTITMLYVETFPRRVIFLFGAATMTLVNAICATSYYFTMEYHNERIYEYLFLLGNILILVFYSGTIQPMTNTLNSEFYPQAVKGLCGSLVTMSQSLSLMLSYQMYNFINNHFHNYLIYTICSIDSFMLYVVVYFFLQEARGAFLSDIQMKFKENPSPNGNIIVKQNSQ